MSEHNIISPFPVSAHPDAFLECPVFVVSDLKAAVEFCLCNSYACRLNRETNVEKHQGHFILRLGFPCNENKLVLPFHQHGPSAILACRIKEYAGTSHMFEL